MHFLPCGLKKIFRARFHLAAGLTLLLLGLPGRSPAYFQDLGMGVRAEGMGEAFTAMADDSNTLLFNSAGLGSLRTPELNLMYSNLYTNLQARLYTGETDSMGFHNVAGIWPFPKSIGTLGVGWTLFDSKLYRENTFILGFGRSLGEELFSWLELDQAKEDYEFFAGLNAKVLNWLVVGNEFTDQNSAFSGGLSRTGFTMDAGLLGTWKKTVKVGLSFENFIPADMGLTVYENVPFNFRAGASYLHNWLGKAAFLDSTALALDFTYRNDIADIRAGLESWFFNGFFGLRAGSTWDSFTLGMSLNSPFVNNLTARLDYAFVYPYSIKDTWGSHRVSLVIRWNSTPAADTLNQLREEKNGSSVKKDEIKEDAALSNTQMTISPAPAPAGKVYSADNPPEKARQSLEEIENQIRLGKLQPILFVENQAGIRPASLPTLDVFGKILEKYPEVRIRIEVKTKDLVLAKDRAQNVKDYLINHFKLSPGNLIIGQP